MYHPRVHCLKILSKLVEKQPQDFGHLKSG